MRIAAAILVFTFLDFSVFALAEERAVKLVNVPSDRGFQEMATVLRTVTDVQRINIDSEHQLLNLEASPANLNAAEWLTHRLDKPAGWQPSSQDKGNPAAREYRLPATEADGVVRVFPLPPATDLGRVQQLITELRSKPIGIMKVYGRRDPPTIAVRGTAAQVEQAEKLVSSIK